MFEIIFLVVLAAFAIGGIWAYVVSKKVKEEGIETDAVVSRIELHEWGGGAEEPWTPSKITTSLIPIRKERPWRRCSAIRETINLKKATD